VPGWLSGLFGNQVFTALLGVVLGALLGFVGAALLTSAQARSAHRTAVLAVLVELTGNHAALVEVRKAGVAATSATLDTSAYDALLMPLYSRLPVAVAAPVGVAYSRLHTFKSTPILVATENPDKIRPAVDALFAYATERLQLDLRPPSPG